MPAWQRLSNEYGIHLIEDCAQAHMALSNGQCAGSFGVIGAYSFYPTKNLGAAGDAGMLVAQEKNVASRAIQLRNYGQSERYHHPVLGMNSRLDELQAAILKERINYLPNFTARRKEIANMYFSNIRNSLINLMNLPDEYDSHVYHLYVIRSKHRQELQSFLTANEIQSLIHYPVPIHFQEAGKSIIKIPNSLSVSEKYAQECLSIPCHPHMTNSEVEKIVDALNRFSNK
jgi:dTDP-4-amino-4,6-dideoxygalactose transaminase